MSEPKRNLLMKKIVSYFTEKGEKMSFDICERISEQMPKYFSGETKVILLSIARHWVIGINSSDTLF